jgi:hypothetical protein
MSTVYHHLCHHLKYVEKTREQTRAAIIMIFYIKIMSDSAPLQALAKQVFTLRQSLFKQISFLPSLTGPLLLLLFNS